MAYYESYKKIYLMKILFEVTFWTQWVLLGELFRPVVVSGGPKLNGVDIYTYILAGRRFFWFAPTRHIFWPLKWRKWFFLKIIVFKIWAENFVARNKKSQNSLSMYSWTPSMFHNIGRMLSSTPLNICGSKCEKW